MMIGELIQVSKIRLDKISKIREYIQNGIPVVQFGNGLLASELKKWLSEQGIFLTEQFVSSEAKKSVEEKTFDDMKSKYERFVVLICVAAPHIVRMKSEQFAKDEQVVDVIYLGDNYPAGEAFLTTDYVKAHEKELIDVYSLLADDLSRQSMFNFLAAKLSGESIQWLNYNDAVDKAGAEYFNDVFSNCSDTIFVDGGAYNGDTYLDFVKEVPKYLKYYAFEPDQENYDKLLETTHDDDKVMCINKGLYKEETTMRFQSVGTMSSRIADDDSAIEVEVTSIDQTASDANFIKLDIEGAEMDTLAGAIRTIKNNKPRMAICAYHTIDDIWRIPAFIQRLNMDYRIYYRIHQREWCRDLIMYAYVEE